MLFRRLLPAALTAASIVVAGAAVAADMPVIKPLLTPVPVYIWTGHYVGIAVGYGWADVKARPPGGGPETSWDADGPMLGVLLGFNWQTGRFVWGGELDWHWSDVSGSSANIAGTGPGSSTVKSVLALRAKAGMTIDDRTLAYLLFGPAWANAELSSPTIGNPDATHTGWTAGIGIDRVFGERFVLGLRANYYSFDKQRYNPEVEFSRFEIVGTGTITFNTGSFLSDRRLKRDVVPVGRLDSGLGLYRYRYLWSDTEYVGVMAQEVAQIVPAAVSRGDDGFLRVDYDRLGLRLIALNAR